jgi:hypothetical protein
VGITQVNRWKAFILIPFNLQPSAYPAVYINSQEMKREIGGEIERKK